jgi:pyruvate dehydrogenase E2 component (dihydrolipoamide acetyltransferase)
MPIELTMPALSPTMEEGKLARWLVAEGDSVKSGDLLAEIETDKATMEVEAVDDGTFSKIVVPEGTEGVKVGAVIALITATAADASGGAPVKPEAGQPAKVEATAVDAPRVAVSSLVVAPIVPAAMNNGTHQAKASSLARRIADAKGIDLRGVNGSGPGGKIVKADLGLPDSVPPRIAPAVAPVVSLPAYGPPAGVPHDVIDLSGMRKTIARRLAEAKQTVPHFYLTVDCNLDALLELRGKLNATLADSGVKLSVNDFLIKALALALAKVPGANVQFAGDRMYRFGRVDVSMAVAIDGGLITPVIVDAANKRLSVIAKEAKGLAALARDGKLKPEHYQGGTASISNLGMFGIKEMVPVINPPQGMILGIGAGERRPYVVDDELAVATVLSATGSFDHRAIDGAVGAELMRVFKQLVERPMSMLA